MRVFNLAEELEKERKKNKELEKQLKCKKEYTKYLPEDTEFIILTKPDYDRQQEELQDKVFELQERIDKAVLYIIHENFKRTILIGVGTKKYTRNILDNVLNILKGDNNE
jgi:hypothetical protein